MDVLSSLFSLEGVLLLVVVGLVVLVLREFLRPAPSPPRIQPPKPKPVMRDMTLEELSLFRGENGNPIYIAVEGKVYDVSAKPEFYGPGGPYHVFSGHDASYCLAKHSVDPADIGKPVEGISYAEREDLDQWKMSYDAKYPVVGRIVEEVPLSKNNDNDAPQ